MSTKSLKHVVKRRVHLERSQPHERKKKFAILEKHSDYVLRAKDYHKKQKILQNLREKTRTRNPDEFYFKMVNSRLDEKGRYEKLNNEKIKKEGQAQTNLENRNLVNFKKSIELRGAEKSKLSLHLISGAKPKTHLLFRDHESDEEGTISDDNELASLSQQNSEDGFHRIAAKLGIEFLRKERKSQATPSSEHSIAAAAGSAEAAMENLVKTYESYKQRKDRVKSLDHTIELLEKQKNLATKGHVRVVKGSDGERNIHVWAPSRKR